MIPQPDEVAADNVNTAPVTTFTDGPTERYSVGREWEHGFQIWDRTRTAPIIANAYTGKTAQTIVDALNAWEESQ